MKPIVAFDAGIAVGVAGMVGRMALAGAETDPVKISPQYYRVRIDNEWLRVLEYRLKPGQKADQISGLTGGLSSAAGPGNRPTIGLRHFGSTTAREAVIEVASDLEATRVANSVCGSSASCRSSLRFLRIAPN